MVPQSSRTLAFTILQVLFTIFGNSIQYWITVNEPLSFCHDGYGGDDAPGARASGVEDYMCAHNVLIAHARVYHLYRREFSQKQNGKEYFIFIKTGWNSVLDSLLVTTE